MDHHPYPNSPTLPPVDVPYVCKDVEPYDGLGFVGYPVRKGWMSSVQQFEWLNCDAEMAAIRAQSWLYFGLLQECLGDVFQRVSFLERIPDTEQYLVRTKQLPSLCNQRLWKLNIIEYGLEHRYPDDGEAEYRRVNGLLIEAARQSERLDLMYPSARPIALSIKVLIASLQIMVFELYEFADRELEIAPSRLVKQRMLDAYWCPYWAEVLFSRHSSLVLYYLSALPRSYRQTEHRACTVKKCQAHNTNTSTYKTKHVEGCRGCAFVGPDMSKVNKIIQGGGVPLISISRTSVGRVKMNVVPAQSNSSYVAISHVWYDGLGNKEANALPRCQVEKLRLDLQHLMKECGLRNRIKGNAPVRLGWTEVLITQRTSPKFWMDTLCVPVAKPMTEPVRLLQRASIERMAFIYSGAESTIVFDSELQRIPQKSIDVTQQIAHIICSAWMSRCWTYQEARLSREWIVLFKDGIFRPKLSVFHRGTIGPRNTSSYFDRARASITSTEFWVKNIKYWNDKALIPWELLDVGYPSPDLRWRQSVKLEQLEKVWNELATRSTTKAEDLHGLLATMTDLSASEILDRPFDRRTQAILQAHRSVPLSLLYFPGPGTKGKSRVSWIPETPNVKIYFKYGKMDVQRNGTSLQFELESTGSFGILVDRHGSSDQHFCLEPSIKSEAWAMPVWININRTGENSSSDNCEEARPFCYVLHGYLKERDSSILSEAEQVGARFILAQSDDGLDIYLVYDCPLTWSVYPPDVLVPVEHSRLSGSEVKPRTSYKLAWDFQVQLTLRYRRPTLLPTSFVLQSDGKPMTNPYIFVFSMFVTIDWIIWTVVYCVVCDIELDKAQVTFPAKIGVSLEAFYWIAFSILRLFLLYFYEGKHLEQALRKDQYSVWQDSHRFVDPLVDTEPSPRIQSPYRLLRYQYEELWVAVLIILASFAIIAASTTLSRHAFKDTPLEPQIYSLWVMGAYLLVDIFLRGCAELLWCQTHLGLWCKGWICTSAQAAKIISWMPLDFHRPKPNSRAPGPSFVPGTGGAYPDFDFSVALTPETSIDRGRIPLHEALLMTLKGYLLRRTPSIDI